MLGLGALGLMVRRRCEEEARVNANRFIMHNFSTPQECFTSHLRCCTLRPCAALQKPYCSVSQGHSHHRSIVKYLSPAQPEQVTAAERADLQTNQPHANLSPIEIFSAPGPLPASLQRACPQYRDWSQIQPPRSYRPGSRDAFSPSTVPCVLFGCRQCTTYRDGPEESARYLQTNMCVKRVLVTQEGAGTACQRP